MTVTIEFATRVVHAYLASLPMADDWLIVEITEFDEGWLFGWQRAAYVLGDNMAASLNNRPLFVSRSNGELQEVVFFSGIKGAYAAAVARVRAECSDTAPDALAPARASWSHARTPRTS